MFRMRRQGCPYKLFILITQLRSVFSDCCDSIAISSTAVGLDYQEHQLGVYTKVFNLTVNNRPVYKQNKGDQYAYYWVGAKQAFKYYINRLT